MFLRIIPRITGILLAAGLLLALVAGVVYAATGTKKVHIDAKHIVRTKEGKGYVLTMDKATVLQEDAKFVADVIVDHQSGDVHEFTCTGNPVFTDPENNITADKVIAYSTPRRAEFENNVVMVSTPKKKDEKNTSDMKANVKEPSTTTCDKLSYDYAGKRALATGNVVVKQKSRTLWADQGTYDQSMDLITLKGNIRMKNTSEPTQNQEFQLEQVQDADTVTVSLKEDWIDIVAKPDQSISIDLDVRDQDNKSGGAAKTPAGPPRPSTDNEKK